jgi:hypothetical protein
MTGRHDPRLGFTTAYLHLPTQFERELEDAGFRDVRIVGVEGPGWMLLKDLPPRSNEFDVAVRLARVADTIQHSFARAAISSGSEEREGQVRERTTRSPDERRIACPCVPWEFSTCCSRRRACSTTTTTTRPGRGRTLATAAAKLASAALDGGCRTGVAAIEYSAAEHGSL